MQKKLQKLASGALIAVVIAGLSVTVWWEWNDYGLLTENQHDCVVAQGDDTNNGGDDTTGNKPQGPFYSNRKIAENRDTQPVYADGKGIVYHDGIKVESCKPGALYNVTIAYPTCVEQNDSSCPVNLPKNYLVKCELADNTNDRTN